MLNRLSYQPLPFAAQRKPASQPVTFGTKKESLKSETPPAALPLYYLMMSGGDGSYYPKFFRSGAERDKAREWVNEHDDEPVIDSDGTVTEAKIYNSAADFIAERE